MKKLIAIIIVIGLIIYGSAQLLPNILKNIAEQSLTEKLQTQVKINDFDVSYKTASFIIKSINIKNYDNEFNILEVNDIKVDLNKKSLFKKTIVIENLAISNISLNLIGGIKDNNLTTVLDTLALEEELEHDHSNETAEEHASHSHHHHEKANLKIALNNFNLNSLNINAKVTEPIALADKNLVIKNIKASNITTEEGLEANEMLEVLLDIIYNQASAEITKTLPAQKAYEETKEAIEKGLNKSKEFIEKTFSQENLDKSKEKATELFNKFAN